jgi:glycine betaine/proline transport system substrate-binding protein
MFRSSVFAAAALGLIACLTLPAQAAGCGRVAIADMNWSSATFIAHVDRFILEHGYGCDAQLVVGDTMPTGTSMIEKGEPDIAPELWTNGIRAALDRGIAEKRLRVVSASLVNGGEEGFWVPQYLVDATPELATIAGVKKHAALFKNPEDPATALFMGCPAGWTCQITAGHLFRALKLAKAGFVLGDPGSGAGLAGSLAKAYERKQPWFGYYWAPTPLLGRYAMVKVDFGSGIDARHFVDCITQPDCADPRPTMYPPSPVQTVVAEGLAERAPDVIEYLSKRGFTNGFMNGFLAWMDDNQADGAVAMAHFLNGNAALWTRWVSDDAAAKIRAALAKR